MPARPKLGQHFLRDEAVLARIAEAAVGPGEAVLEIGPGRGALTRHLLALAREVIAVEIDPDLAGALPERCGHAENLRVRQADILDVDLAEAVNQEGGVQWVAAGNLPYYMTSPILRSVFAARCCFRAATFLMQDEVADRAVARQGSRPYSYLSCLCQLYSAPEKLFKVPAGAFSPRPRVESAVVRFEMLREDPPAGFPAFVAACFRAPRKTLRNNLAGLYPKDAVSMDRCAGLRPGQLGLAEIEALWRRLGARA